MAHDCNSRTWEAEARGLGVQGQLQSHTEFEVSLKYTVTLPKFKSKTKVKANHTQTNHRFLGSHLEIKIEKVVYVFFLYVCKTRCPIWNENILSPRMFLSP